MQPNNEAEENLRVIRSLMEKATIYRAISAPSALAGGVLAMVAAGLLITFKESLAPTGGVRSHFALAWLGVLALSAAANFHFLRQDAGRRGEAFISRGMRLALSSLLPSFLVAAVCTALFSLVGDETALTFIWVILFGLSLLSTAHFAPRSIRFLGWAFLVFGLALTVAAFKVPELFLDHDQWIVANLVMAASFGGFHIVYAALTWPRAVREGAGAIPSTDV